MAPEALGRKYMLAPSVTKLTEKIHRNKKRGWLIVNRSHLNKDYTTACKVGGCEAQRREVF